MCCRKKNWKGSRSHGAVGAHAGHSLRVRIASNLHACVAVAATLDRSQASEAARLCLQVWDAVIWLTCFLFVARSEFVSTRAANLGALF